MNFTACLSVKIVTPIPGDVWTIAIVLFFLGLLFAIYPDAIGASASFFRDFAVQKPTPCCIIWLIGVALELIVFYLVVKFTIPTLRSSGLI